MERMKPAMPGSVSVIGQHFEQRQRKQRVEDQRDVGQHAGQPIPARS